MKYGCVVSGRFIERPNRFIAKVETSNGIETVHVKNTGRCKELLVPGATVYLEKSNSSSRKTGFDLIAVEKRTEKGKLLINMDSQAPNAIAEEWLRKGNLVGEGALIKREITHGDSRFDIYAENDGRKIYIEVKGVTLENDGVASFPDAPTERGLKHVRGLTSAVKEGFEAYLLFVVQMKGVKEVIPNDITMPLFGEALREARAAGVGIVAVDCNVGIDVVEADTELPVII